MQITKLGFKETTKVDFASLFLNQPVSAPPIFDVDKYLSMARARMKEARDQLWLLQTEPSYMRYTMKYLNQDACLSLKLARMHTLSLPMNLYMICWSM